MRFNQAVGLIFFTLVLLGIFLPAPPGAPQYAAEDGPVGSSGGKGHPRRGGSFGRHICRLMFCRRFSHHLRHRFGDADFRQSGLAQA